MAAVPPRQARPLRRAPGQHGRNSSCAHSVVSAAGRGRDWYQPSSRSRSVARRFPSTGDRSAAHGSSPVSLTYSSSRPFATSGRTFPGFVGGSRGRRPPLRWVIVDTASTAPVEVAATLALAHAWISVVQDGRAVFRPPRLAGRERDPRRRKGGGFARARVVVELDADCPSSPITSRESYARRGRAARNRRRHVFEYADGVWLERPVSARHHVLGAARA